MSGKRAAPWLTIERRGKLYRIATAAGVVAAFYGLATDAEVAVWLGLVATVLGTGTASAFTPATKRGADAGA